MTESHYSRIEKNIDTFPSLPSTVAEVMNVVNNPESSAKELTQAILPDQSMCVAILKIANSALYGRPKKVSSLETAITVLGFDEIENIVLSKSVLNAFGAVFQRNDTIISDFWDHSFTCALAGKIIAEHFSITAPGRFFIGGLIHDIGKLAMLLTFPEEYSAEKWLSGFSSAEKLEEEQRLFGITHQEVGGRLLEKWNFPEQLVNALQYHHRPDDSQQNLGFPIIVQLADVLSYICCTREKEEVINIEMSIRELIPGIETTWNNHKLSWESLRLEMWYNWVVIERKHGSSILAILAY
ncbi:HDOD domain-containing protein [Desulfopila inferna]|uniref:HDOD domain-containing protein n=1 Tax=Desulfopila inferna TaxID=468528 RepID=UPI0019655DC9|nr:HDOD domain-containing protein [Desulfopila inferna]MBM9604323.1 HDOD domain-containing protein [Desulfopila inferna]